MTGQWTLKEGWGGRRPARSRERNPGADEGVSRRVVLGQNPLESPPLEPNSKLGFRVETSLPPRNHRRPGGSSDEPLVLSHTT